MPVIIAVSLFYVWPIFFTYCWRIFLGEKKNAEQLSFQSVSVICVRYFNANRLQRADKWESSFVDTIIVRERQFDHSRKELGGKNVRICSEVSRRTIEPALAWMLAHGSHNGFVMACRWIRSERETYRRSQMLPSPSLHEWLIVIYEEAKSISPNGSS